jgi:hypothetical protein
MKLYKYFPKERIDFFDNRLIRLTPAAALNDPFEMFPVYDSIFVTGKRRNKHHSFLGVPLQRIHAIGEQWADMFFNRTAFIQHYLSERYGMFCLSERYDSLLMWAHYASDHRGFIVEVDGAHAWFNRRQLLPEVGEVGVVRKVTYSNERPITFLKHAPTNVFLVKGKDWTYEQEWRIVLPLARAVKVINSAPTNIHLFKVPCSAISRVIFGARMAASDRNRVLHLLSNPHLAHVQFMQAVLSPRRFAVDITTVVRKRRVRQKRQRHENDVRTSSSAVVTKR